MTYLPTHISLSDLEQRIESVFSMAEIMKEPANATYDRLVKDVILPLKKTYANGRYKFTTYVRVYADGYIAAKRSFVMRNLVEFCYLYEGNLYSTFKGTMHRSIEEIYAAGMGHLLSNCPSAFYWKGTDKPYTELS